MMADCASGFRGGIGAISLPFAMVAACVVCVMLATPVTAQNICIENDHVLSGQEVEVSITIENVPIEMGGFDFLIGYDNSAAAFGGGTAGQLLEDCGWEYFTYRYGVEGNCGDACPKGLMRIIAMADLDDGPSNHPSCYGPPDTDPHELVKMRFTVSADRNFIDQCLPIYFFWDDCGDNAVSSVDGYYTYLDSRIYSADGGLLWDEDDDDNFPEDARPTGLGAPDECLEGSGPDKPEPIRLIDYCFGRICIDEPPDDRGDINLNGIANEVADAVLFSNYFIYGNAVWDPVWEDVQVLATDINDDGIVLTIADLVYLIRVITGDEQAYPPGENPKVSPATASVGWNVTDGQLIVNWDCDADAGALLLAFNHAAVDIGAPELLGHASGLDMIAHDDGAQLRVLIYGMEKSTKISSGTGAIVRVPVNGAGPVALAEAAAADYYGRTIRIAESGVGAVPRRFALKQNVPNPFNASTRISFDVPEAGDVSLIVYDLLGRQVAVAVSGYFEAGMHNIIWDARDRQGRELASGVYVYRLVTGQHSATRKMVLLK